MFIKQSSLVLAASLVIAGCSSTSFKSEKELYANAFLEPVQASQMLADKAPCCDNFNQLQYQTINNDEPLFIPLTNDSQVYAFDSGKSYVQAYKLSNIGTKLKLTVSSLMYNSVLVPQITLLDANFNVTRTITADKFKYEEAELLTGDALNAELTIYLTQANNAANETYLLFYTTDKAAAGSTTIIHPAKSFAKAHSTVPPSIPDPIIPHSSVGLIKLNIDVEGTRADAENSYIPAPMAVHKAVVKKEKLAPKTEAEYNQAIIAAVTANDLDKALSIVDEAKAAGSTSAKETFIKALKK